MLRIGAAFLIALFAVVAFALVPAAEAKPAKLGSAKLTKLQKELTNLAFQGTGSKKKVVKTSKKQAKVVAKYQKKVRRGTCYKALGKLKKVYRKHAKAVRQGPLSREQKAAQAVIPAMNRVFKRCW